ncbi:MAG: cytochrome c [Rhodospirillales bacterium]
MIKHLSLFATAVVFTAAFGAATPAFADTAQAANPATAVQLAAKTKFPPPVENRKKAMKTLSSNMKGMKKALAAKDQKTAEKHAAGLVNAASTLDKNVDKLFDKKTAAVKGTRAKKEIWQDWKKFKAGMNALNDKTTALAKAVKSGGDADEAFKAVGKTCSGCHKAFRGKKPKKN